ncbi:molybdopterin molybdotransferase MoeA [Alphaproteobacteria bacterium]|nr:molybdopterin molybdotransferase MoeA [Alphaproteobacteria bacterium]
MYKYSQIEKLIKNNVSVIKDTEIIKIRYAKDRCLAENIYSKINIPPNDNAAVDGYLFNYKELILEPSRKYKVALEIHAGDDKTRSYSTKNAIKVSTGAFIPKQFDTLVMQEDIDKKNQLITVKKKVLKKWMNIRKKGEDIKKNQKVFVVGHFLRPQDVGMLASLGLKEIKVVRKIKVGILSNGNELLEPGKKKSTKKIYDSNRYILSSFLNKNNITLLDTGIVKDDYKKIENKIKILKQNCDLVIISGGASSGSKDYIVNIIKKIGTIKFWKVSIKPGRPFGFGLIGKRKPILILPGNPVACFIIFFLFGKILLNYLQSKISSKMSYFFVKSNFTMKKKLGREEFLRGKLVIKNGEMFVDKYSKQGAGILNSLVWSNGLIRLKSNSAFIYKNSILEFYPFE